MGRSVSTTSTHYVVAIATVAAAAGLTPFFWSSTDILRIFAPLLVALAFGLLYVAKNRAQIALRERDARLKLVSEQIPCGLWSTDTELRITSGFGARAGLLHGPVGSILNDHFKTDDPAFVPIVAHHRALQGEPSTYEVQWAGRTFQSHVEPLRDGDGEIIGVVGVAIDITERKDDEEALRHAKKQLETASQAKDRFLATLSHELRTPLAPVLALASAVAERTDLPADLKEDIETIRRNVLLEATLIDDLLDITRISRGKLQLHFQNVDAHDLLQSAAKICLPDGEEKGVSVELELQSCQPIVRADAARLQQVFWNLIKNSIKFTPAGGTVRVQSADAGDNRLRVEISDTGIGISSEVLPRIFDAFEQGDPSITRQFGGLGLGLAICKALVESHHGKIVASSDGEGKGACFSVELATLDAGAESSATAPGPVDDAVARALKILLVEDHVDTAKVMRRLLSDSGHQVETAGTVASALRMLDGGPVDLLISDVGLPDGSGLDLMREVAIRYHLKGIALSGFGAEEDVQRSLAAGFAAHLTKPVPISTLRQTINHVAAASNED
jgi:signal transduction histidine kinase/CheY-like chemotaxis protein